MANSTGTFGTGKRKGAIARIKIMNSKGDITVNEMPIAEYFPTEYAKTQYLKAFHILGLNPEAYTITIKTAGGGKSAQLESVSKGIAKAFLEINPEFRPRLKDAKLLHRDPRVRERRKYGLAGKARAKKSSPKR